MQVKPWLFFVKGQFEPPMVLFQLLGLELFWVLENRGFAEPFRPVDPGRVDVRGSDVNVLGERNDGNIDVTGGFGEADSELIMSFAAVWSADILPLDAIDPVLSNTIATRMRELPHVDVELVPKLSCGKPTTFMKSVLMAPVPEARIVAAADDVLGV